MFVQIRAERETGRGNAKQALQTIFYLNRLTLHRGTKTWSNRKLLYSNFFSSTICFVSSDSPQTRSFSFSYGRIAIQNPTGDRLRLRGPVLESTENFRATILFVSSKGRCSVLRNFAVIFIFIPFSRYEKTSLQNKRVGVLRIAFRVRKVFGSFEKRTPDSYI